MTFDGRQVADALYGRERDPNAVLFDRAELRRVWQEELRNAEDKVRQFQGYVAAGHAKAQWQPKIEYWEREVAIRRARLDKLEESR